MFLRHVLRTRNHQHQISVSADRVTYDAQNSCIAIMGHIISVPSLSSSDIWQIDAQFEYS